MANMIFNLDLNKNNAHFNFVKSLQMAGDEALVSMEDDAVLCDNFHEKLLAEIAKRPDEIIQFFSRRDKDITVGERYETGANFNYNICFYLPAGMSKKLLDYNADWIEKNPDRYFGSPYDIMMQEYFKEQKLKYWIVIPNLVDHKEDRSSIDSRRNPRRHSKTFKK